MRRDRLTLTAGALAAALLLAGCASSASSDRMPGMHHTEQTGDTANAADVMFATMMIPHHEQAIEMSDLLLGKEDIDERVRDLAQQIKGAQAPEIETMTGWLDAWGTPFDPDNAHGMDHGDGMMSQKDMTALETATGPEASRLFLEQMILHHQGAIDMANSVLDDGARLDVRALAEQIVRAQTEEIATMRDLLTEL